MGQLSLGDIDGDRRFDFVSTDRKALYVQTHPRVRDLNGAVIYTPSTPANSVEDTLLLDADHDGALDVVVAQQEGLAFLRNQGGGGFELTHELPAGVFMSGIVTGDVTGDGLPDAVIAMDGARAGIAVFPHDVESGFDTTGQQVFFETTPPSSGVSFVSVAVGDLNNDGRQDVAAVTHQHTSGPMRVWILLQDDLGHLTAPQPLLTIAGEPLARAALRAAGRPSGGWRGCAGGGKCCIGYKKGRVGGRRRCAGGAVGCAGGAARLRRRDGGLRRRGSEAAQEPRDCGAGHRKGRAGGGRGCAGGAAGLRRRGGRAAQEGGRAVQEGGGAVRRVDPGTTVTLASAKEQIAAVLKVSKGKRRPLLVDIGSRFTDMEAREYFASVESRTAWRAVATLSPTPVGVAQGKMWAAAHSTADNPAWFYFSEPEAIEWLKGFVEQ